MKLHSVNAATWYLLVGTDLGVFYTDNKLSSCPGGSRWHPITGLPRVSVQDIEVVTKPTGTVIRVATYGRGVWEMPVAFPAGGCSCDACGEGVYPLFANISALPEGTDAGKGCETQKPML